MNSCLHMVASGEQTNPCTRHRLQAGLKQLAVTYMERLAVSAVPAPLMRIGERARQWLRRERVFERGGYWYFRTREGIDVGPYTSRFEAEIESDILVARLSRDATAQSARVIRAFILESMRQRTPGQVHQDIGALVRG